VINVQIFATRYFREFVEVAKFAKQRAREYFGFYSNATHDCRSLQTVKQQRAAMTLYVCLCSNKIIAWL